MTETAHDRRRLPVADVDTARVIGGAGVLACVACCVSIPSVAAAISALGLGFLRNERVLVPAAIVSVTILIATFVQARAHHGRRAPLLLGLAASAGMLVGITRSAPLGTIVALSGAVAVVAVVVWDWRLQKRCGVT